MTNLKSQENKKTKKTSEPKKTKGITPMTQEKLKTKMNVLRKKQITTTRQETNQTETNPMGGLDTFALELNLEGEDDKENEPKLRAYRFIGSILMYKLKFFFNSQGFKNNQHTLAKLQQFFESMLKKDHTLKIIGIQGELSIAPLSNSAHLPTDENHLRSYLLPSRNKSCSWNLCGIMQVETIRNPEKFTEIIKTWNNAHNMCIKVFPDEMREMVKLGFFIRSSQVMGHNDLTKTLMSHQLKQTYGNFKIQLALLPFHAGSDSELTIMSSVQNKKMQRLHMISSLRYITLPIKIIQWGVICTSFLPIHHMQLKLNDAKPCKNNKHSIKMKQDKWTEASPSSTQQ